MEYNERDMKDILNYINPALLNYQEWVNVGMALKLEGYSVNLFDDWSRQDTARYKKGECSKKWFSFNGSQKPVTMGTVMQYAYNQGYKTEGHELAWEDAIGKKEELKVINQNWVEEKDLPPPNAHMDGAKEIIRYLENLFEPSENVGYVFASYSDDNGKYIPKNKGSYDRTAGELIEGLKKCNGDIGLVFGDYNTNAGAWIRFNPLDGKGVKNENVTEYRYALVESDTETIEKQYTLLTELQLPIAVMVHSGKKSVHAIVKIDAVNYDEYRKRVDFLYSVCQKNGIDIDKQNRNPSRLSRVPGVQRGEQKQYIIAENTGLKNFMEWKEYIESINDDLPDVENLESVFDNLPALAPQLIQGVLRQGHKMLLVGPSKAGKSYALIELCIAIAEKHKWMGLQCEQGHVLYVNLELDRASCLHRFKEVYEALCVPPKNIKNLDIWNLRGKSVPMDKLAPMLIRRAQKRKYIAVIIDPIYKVITGDENSADQMANFCNQFDKICTELNTAVIYCHHHSKGSQGQKRSADRASGSGVFARDPDAMLDMIELPLPIPTQDSMVNAQKREDIIQALNETSDTWEEELSQDDMCSHVMLQRYFRENVTDATYRAFLQKFAEKEEKIRYMTAWRLESTLREFAPIKPVQCFFKYPIHVEDARGILQDLTAEGQRKTRTDDATSARRKTAEEQRKTREEELQNAVNNANMGAPCNVKDVSLYMNVKEDTVRRWLKKYGYDIDKNTGFIQKMEMG